MSALDELFAKLQGRDPDAEEDTKKKAQQGIDNYETQSGTKYQDEAGIEPDEVTEGLVTLPFMGPASGMAKRAGGFAVKQAEKAASRTVLDKMKEGGAPKPTFSEGVSTGKTTSGPTSFSKWVRGEAKSVPESKAGTLAEGPMAKGDPKNFNGLEQYGATDTMARTEQTGFMEKLRQLRDVLFQKEGNSQRVKDINKQIGDMKFGPSMNSGTSATQATTGFQSKPGIYVNPKLK